MASNKTKSTSKQGRQRGNQSKAVKFEDYWTQDQVEAGIKTGALIHGYIRVNPKNFEESFILHPKGDADVLVDGLIARNRALNDDEVAVLIEPIRSWKVVQAQVSLTENGDKTSNRLTVEAFTKGNPQAAAGLFPGAELPIDLTSNMDPVDSTQLFQHVTRTGRVVAIVRPMHHRVAVGTVKPMAPPENNPMKRMLFCPVDRRVPRMILERDDYPPNIFSRIEDFAKSYLMARLVSWPSDSVYGRGRVMRLLGEKGEIAVERESILITHGIAETDFSEEVLACLPQASGDPLDPVSLSQRRDFRDECVFTIDPATARDLDDALHIRELEPGCRYEVGVHIADVSYYVPENSALDIEARKRATSVYLVDQVVPMLPRQLCEELCSLNPGELKLTFSVVWEMDGDGHVSQTWFGRSVIKSCTKLSYSHAQSFIANRDRNEWPPDQIPQIFQPWRLSDIVRAVRMMADITSAMRKRRFANGALVLNTPKLGFVMDSSNGLPCGVQREKMAESNFLVEEFMLLANISVAQRIFKAFPNEAFLRRHPPPSERALVEVQQVLESLGVAISTRSAADIQESLKMTTANMGSDKTEVLVNLLSKPMQLARYFCAGQMARSDREMELAFTHHYALSVELYTHFTSPIRRFPDIIVHRQLAAALEGRDTSLVAPEDNGNVTQPSLDNTAEWCNWRKKNAKLAGEASRDLYLRAFIAAVGSLDEDGIVLGVLDHSFDVLLLSLGIIKRVYCEQIENIQDIKFTSLANVKGAGCICLRFSDNTIQMIRPMSKVQVTLRNSKKEDELKFDVFLVVKPTGPQATG